MQEVSETGITRLSDGRLKVRVTAKCPTTGKMKYSQRTMREGATIAEAVELREELREKLKTPAQPTRPGPQITTLADYAEHWVARKERRWRPKTIDTTLRTLAKHILPEMGHLPIDRLTRRDVSGWISWAESQRLDDGRLYARSTVQRWWRVLRNMLRDAFAAGYLEADLTIRQDPPDTGAGGRQEKRTLSGDELRRFVDAAKRFQPARYAEIVTLAYTGMRAGELYALHWGDIGQSDGVIHIRKSVWKGKVSPPKTGSIRTVPMTEVVASALEEHRQMQIREQAPGLDEGIVFPSSKGGYRMAASLRKPMRLIAEHIGLEQRVSPQVLRRTFNTLLVAAQVDRITIRSMTGHSSERMTEHYAGISHQIKKEALGTALGSSPATWHDTDLGKGG